MSGSVSMTKAEGQGGGLRLDLMVIAGIVLLVLAVGGWLLSQRQQTLRASPTGTDGLHIWLAAGGMEVQTFTGGWLVDPDRLGLLVVPLYDSDLQQELEPARTTDALLFQPDEFDQSASALREKAAMVQTLVVLPKWRRGMRLTGLAHPDLRIDAAQVEGVLADVLGDTAPRVVRPAEGTPRLAYLGADGAQNMIRLYAPQLMEAGRCTVLVGQGNLALLARCPILTWDGPADVLVLSDPDLLNNHGLRLGDNATVARALLGELADGAPVMIDLSSENWLAASEGVFARDRTWADLLRFFEPPFLAVWLALAGLLALALWRSFWRAGPLVPEGAGGGAKAQAIGARARLMRLTGQDGAMLGDYARARLATTAARLVGPGQARQLAEEGAFLRFVARRDAPLAEALGATLSRLHALPPSVAAGVAIHHVEELERHLEQIAHEP
jgi:hypothetical protein